MKLIFAFVFLFLIPHLSYAMKPCPPAKSDSELKKSSTWIAVAQLIKKENHKEPFPNCALEDKTKCAMMDTSRLTFEIINWKKGTRKETQLRLQSALCANSVPSQINAKFILYGNSNDVYDYIQDYK